MFYMTKGLELRLNRRKQSGRKQKKKKKPRSFILMNHGTVVRAVSQPVTDECRMLEFHHICSYKFNSSILKIHICKVVVTPILLYR